MSMKKLVLFGDSLFGQLGKHRIINLEKVLSDYDVYNCAAGGWNTNDCVQKSPYIALLKPDAVVISLGTNDAAPWKQVPLDTFKDNLPKIFATFSSSEVVYFLPPPVNESELEDDEKTLNNEIMKQYHDAAKQACTANNVRFIDSWNVFMPMLQKGTEYHVEDGMHLNDLAYDTIANELVSLLK
jgi:lysophospholipase L1-like esterase